eukprot:PhF_6_TR8302/c0_g1_i1/m.12805
MDDIDLMLDEVLSPKSPPIVPSTSLTAHEVLEIHAHYYQTVVRGVSLNNLPAIFAEVLVLHEFLPEEELLNVLVSSKVRWHPGTALSLQQFETLLQQLKEKKYTKLVGRNQIHREAADVVEAVTVYETPTRSDVKNAIRRFGLNESLVDDAIPMSNSSSLVENITSDDIELMIQSLTEERTQPTVTRSGSLATLEPTSSKRLGKLRKHKRNNSMDFMRSFRRSSMASLKGGDSRLNLDDDDDDELSTPANPLQHLQQTFGKMAEGVVFHAPGTVPLKHEVAMAWRQQDRKDLFSSLEGFLAVASAKKIVDGAFASSGLHKEMYKARPPRAVITADHPTHHSKKNFRASPHQALDEMETNGVAKDIVSHSALYRQSQRDDYKNQTVYDRLYPHHHHPVMNIKQELRSRLGVAIDEKNIPRRPLSAMSVTPPSSRPGSASSVAAKLRKAVATLKDV